MTPGVRGKKRKSAKHKFAALLFFCLHKRHRRFTPDGAPIKSDLSDLSDMSDMSDKAPHRTLMQTGGAFQY